MARPTSPVLTDAELRLMKVLWEHGPSTAGEVVAALAGEVSLAESTVRTMLGILRDKGYVGSEPRGRAQVYGATVSRGEVRRRAVKHLVGRLFDGSPSELVLNLLRDDGLDAAEVERLKRILEEEG